MRLTIQEVANKWGIKDKTVMEYISKGWIEDIQADNNIITLPDIPKPYQIRNSGKTTTQGNIYKNIMQACDKNQYISAFMLGISQKDFEISIQALKNENLIIKSSETSKYSNIGYKLTPKSKMRKDMAKTINITFNFNVDSIIKNNVGLMNIGC